MVFLGWLKFKYGPPPRPSMSPENSQSRTRGRLFIYSVESKKFSWLHQQLRIKNSKSKIKIIAKSYSAFGWPDTISRHIWAWRHMAWHDNGLDRWFGLAIKYWIIKIQTPHNKQIFRQAWSLALLLRTIPKLSLVLCVERWR